MRLSVFRLGWGKGAIHPNTSNFRRNSRYDVVARVRRLCETGLLKERPKWLEWAERVPPLENHNLNLQIRKIRNPYTQMIDFLLKKYPDLRFQDCYVDGNDWSVGNDAYRNDHPVMQFVARQLDFMNEGYSKKEAFAKTEELFRDRREYLENEQKVMMAMAINSGLAPMFTSGHAYLQAEAAKAETAHLQSILQQLREVKQDIKKQREGESLETRPQKRRKEQEYLADVEKERIDLIVDAHYSALPSDVHGEAASTSDHSLENEEQETRKSREQGEVDEQDEQLPQDNTMRSVLDRDTSQVPETRQDLPSALKPPDDLRKAEDEIMVTASRRSIRDRRQKTGKQLGSMIGMQGGVQGEDFGDDSDDEAEARKRKRRQIDDDDDDEIL